MRFGVLGPLESAVPVGGPRPRALLALLLLDAGRVVSFERLVDGLYGEEPPTANALQAQVSRLRRKLGADAIELHSSGYRLNVDPDDVDVHRFTQLVREAAQSDRAAELLGAALDLWRGPALADVDGPFVEPERARLEELRLTAIEDHAGARLALGDAPVTELQDLARAHPLRERLHALLLRALTASGRQAEALALFDEVRRRLADELGADPSPELTAAHLAALRAEPLSTTAVPAQLTRFLGREDELTRVAELLGRARLVTLTGPGGAGKTRLAIEAAARQDAETAFVDLTSLREVPQAVLAALGLRETSLFGGSAKIDPIERITTALTGRRLLLVLDNCEHVIEDTAAFVHRLLAACPGLRVLATSREPLAITGEALCPLPPLRPPAAVELFAERAAAVAPGVHLDETLVERICAALDGLPLAIELAAARLRTLPLADLASRLDDRFRVLSRGSRTAAPRHRTLRAVVEWSWDLLSDPERELLRRLSVFPGGVTVESARAVSDVDTEELLTGLADKSLLEVADGRFRMLETIRAYCAEQLGEREQVCRAQAEYFLGLARTADPRLRGAEQLTWLARLTAEHANLQAALRWAVDADPPLALRLVGALTPYWRLRGVRGEVEPLARRLLDDVIEGLEEEYVLAYLAAGPSPVDEHRRRAEAVMATLDRPLRQPYLAVGWALFSGPPEVNRPLTPLDQRILGSDEPWLRALARFSMSYLDLIRGEQSRAGDEFAAALGIFRSLGDRWGMAQALDGLAALAELRGSMAEAVTLTEEAIELVGQLGAVEELAELWCRHGDRLRDTDPEAAAADYRRSGELARRAGVPATLALAYLGFGELARRRGELAEARRWCTRALDECGAGWQSTTARSKVLRALGRVATDEGRFAEARTHHGESIRIALRQGLHPDLVEAATAAADLARRSGDTTLAAQLNRAQDKARTEARAQPLTEVLGELAIIW
ncbi:putative ATPase/DNA-binding SARP family transcriptional activator [Amycolatopsis bartoniae]|uniref:SARP family transcriptional regulator n=1 Tax=Amycolatopsis bartoniae TaxID=941986 RepID=A0A8H9J0R3_9PSEU|nr:BTAD domain-containing putative transcriptional regulator [Amycolatopsis bartoniae]MBB2934176.1 putative ATPase/DNA-binding SARP family transcriptional activator [Amycolatopsis bartoniae]TVT08711.1 AfsR/SARP family transcriptional regulator [Amycolatopsis bartoniae]GHF88684.1 SARP family transcriptional regulator [Amycolatopsis bartoniae]